jgi:hypothetical protein
MRQKPRTIVYGMFSLAIIGLCVLGVCVDGRLSRIVAKPKAGYSAQTGNYSVARLRSGSSAVEDRMTLFVLIRNGCGHCENSVPFYRNLVRLERQNAIRAHIVFVSPNSKEEMGEMVGTDVEHDRLIPDVELRTLGVTGTPTLLFADQNGNVVKACIGEVSSQAERGIVDELQ